MFVEMMGSTKEKAQNQERVSLGFLTQVCRVTHTLLTRLILASLREEEL